MRKLFPPTPNASAELGNGVFMHKWYTVLIVQEIKNMQGTLYKFGFTRKVKTECGKCYDVTSLMPNTVQSITKPVKCDVCNEDFKSKQYLDQHVFWKHRPTTGAEELKVQMSPLTFMQVFKLFIKTKRMNVKVVMPLNQDVWRKTETKEWHSH